MNDPWAPTTVCGLTVGAEGWCWVEEGKGENLGHCNRINKNNDKNISG